MKEMMDKSHQYAEKWDVSLNAVFELSIAWNNQLYIYM